MLMYMIHQDLNACNAGRLYRRPPWSMDQNNLWSDHIYMDYPYTPRQRNQTHCWVPKSAPISFAISHFISLSG